MVILMKKIYIILLIVMVLLCGCAKEEKKEEEQKEIIETQKEEIVESPYQDDNKTPISFYQLKGNQLEKITSITGNYNVLDDIGLFQIYPSNEQTIYLNSSFGSSFYNTWQQYNSQNTLRIGFSLKIPVEGKEPISYTILYPSQTMDQWQYFMAYLYDDYANQGKSFYSHIEAKDYSEETIFTAIKLQCGEDCQSISTPVLFTVFTYDTADDFVEGTYRGNSQSTISLCIHGNC